MKTRTPRSIHSHVTEAVGYAEDVVSGKQPAGNYVRLACARFIADLKRNDLVFDDGAARRACNFIETLPHTKGRWAARGERLLLRPWQKFIVCNIFGFKLPDGRRRFREAYNEIPRKNGKSQLAAAIGLYMLCEDGEFGAEIYSGATTEAQAWEVFRPARFMVERTAALRNHYDIEVNAKTLLILSNGSRFAPLIGKPGDGASPSCAIVDEYHEHETDDLYQTMKTGMGAREQPLMLTITTAGSNFGGPCYEKRRDCIAILEGLVKDDSVFVAIFGIDESDAWDDPASLVKANPNYGVSVFAEFLQAELVQARRSATKQNAFRTKHLNQWVGAKTAWMNMLSWQRQKRAFKVDDFAGCPCWIAVDLASKKDVAALVMLFLKDGQYYCIPRFYAPESAAEENDKYRQFELAGCLTLTPGNMTDQAFVEEEILSLAQQVNLQDVSFDDWQANYLITRLTDTSIPVLAFNQTVKNMSEPMKEVDARVGARTLWHDGNEMMTWMMGNVAAKIDAKENIYPRKENDNDPRCKIDGPVGLIMAMGRALAAEVQPDISGFLANPVIG